MLKELHLTLPLRIRPSKKGKFYSLNLNIYRNLHFNTLNNIKIVFAGIVASMLANNNHTGEFKRPYVTYKFYADSNRTTDLMNWISVIDKFVMDSLVSQHVIPDDSTDFIKEIHCSYGGVDAGKGRVELVLTEEITK